MFRKTYLSTEMSRTMSRMGEPIGDPFGGPSYGEKRMPAVALVFAAYGAGTAITVSMVAAAVAQVGIGMMVAGAVTGNKNLTKYGGYLAMAGGITSMAVSSGMIADSAIIEGTASDAAATSANQALDSMVPTDPTGAVPPVTPTVDASAAVDAAGQASATGSSGSSIPDSAQAPPSPGAAQTITQRSIPSSSATTSTFKPMSVDFTASTKAAVIPSSTDMGAGSGINQTAATGLVRPELVNAPAAYTPPTPSSGGFNLSSLKDIFTGPSGGYAVQGIAKLGGDAISGYAQGQAAQQRLDYEKGLLSQQTYNRGFAGRTA